VNRGSVTSETVGFALGPRINAAGRMDHASRALELLLAADDGEARERAAGIESLNRLRQAKTRGMMDTVEERLDREGVRPVVGLSDPAWPPALVGLVAGRVADRYARPCVAIGKHGGQWIGSGRSPQPIDITALVERAGEGLLRRSGGHAQACGFALDTDDAVTAFLANLDAEGERIQNELRSGPEIAIDAILQLPDLTWGLLESLRRFEPFGMGNPKPVFCTRELRILTADRVGKNGDHLRMTLADVNGRKRPFIGFRFGERVSETRLGMSIDVVYDVTANVWNGREELSCRLVDFRESGT
jgi:single-stranded-DNA-specific exonuclease